MMILEMTAYYKKKNMTLCDALEKLYEKYGNYSEAMIDIYMEGVDGIESRKRVMGSLRENPPTELGGFKIKAIGDYSKREIYFVDTAKKESTNQPSSDVLYYTLENDDKIIIRPSGTEPKIKIYILAHDLSADSLAKKLKIYKESAKKLTDI